MQKKPLIKFNTHLWWKLFKKNGQRRKLPQHHSGHIWEAYSKHYSQWWKTESIPPEIRNKIRESTVSTISQHSFGSFGHSNQSRKRNERNPDWKRGSKTLTVCRWHILYIENPKDSIRKLLELISEFLSSRMQNQYAEITCISVY